MKCTRCKRTVDLTVPGYQTCKNCGMPYNAGEQLPETEKEEKEKDVADPVEAEEEDISFVTIMSSFILVEEEGFSFVEEEEEIILSMKREKSS